MSLDPYSPCPGGTGKKVKFCCQDLVNELGKLQQQMAGGQTAAALEYARGLEDKYPDRACLLSFKTLLAFANRQPETMAETTKRFVEKFPQNPVAHGFKALKLLNDGDLTAAQNSLQDALELIPDNDLPESVFHAIQLLGQGMLNAGHILPAKGLLTLAMIITRGEDKNVMQMLMQLENAPAVPVLLKDVPGFQECDKNAPYRKLFEESLRLAGGGCWRKAAANWQQMLQQNSEDAAIWRNLAVVRGYLGEYRAAADCWRRYAELDVEADDEIEAEATAQLLRRNESEGEVDDLEVTLAVNDAERIEQLLSADSRAERLAVDMNRYNDQGQPPPRSIFALFDKPRATAAESLRAADVPIIIGHVYLFGRETDRAARVELDIYRTQLEACEKLLREIVGDAVGAKTVEQVTGKVSNLELALSWQWRLPENTSWRDRLRLLTEQREHVLLDIWCNLKLPLLDDKTPSECSVDWNMRDRLQAAIMLLEVTDASQNAPAIFTKLREKLGMPVPETLDPDKFDYKRARLPRFLYVPVEPLSDQQLQQCYERVMVAQFLPAARRFAVEILRRPSLRGNLDLQMSSYQVMVRVTEDADQALKLLDDARAYADEKKQSTAPWDLEELALRIARREVNDVNRLVKHISESHLREPGIGEALYGLLMNAGLISPDGRMMMPAAGPAQGNVITTDDVSGKDAGKLWTPDSQDGGEKKSKLWVPD